MNDLVKRLRSWELKISSIPENNDGRAMYVALTEAENDVADAADHIEAQNKTIVEMRAALEMIAGVRPCVDNLLGNADIARMALSKSNPNTHREER